jgi:hypothetical protein
MSRIHGRQAPRDAEGKPLPERSKRQKKRTAQRRARKITRRARSR